jgi:hypothetical protein
VEIGSWDARPERPKLNRDRQNLLKYLGHERYAETGCAHADETEI